MDNPVETYTYRNGKRVELRRLDDTFNVSAPAQVVSGHNFREVTPFSAAMSQVRVLPDDLAQEMSRARSIAPSHHVYEFASSHQQFIPTQRIFITFHESVRTQQIDELLARYELLREEQISPQTWVVRAPDGVESDMTTLVRNLVEDEELVADAENVLMHRAARAGLQLPVDPRYIDQWHLHRHSQHPAFDVRASTNCEKAWELLQGFGSEDVVIGITDDGCQLNHVDFGDPSKFAGWAYFSSDKSFITSDNIDADPNQMYALGFNHGTACAGVAAAAVNSESTVGAAPGCRLLPVRFQASAWNFDFDDLDLYYVLQYISDKVDVLSNSWGLVPVMPFATIVQEKIRELAISGGRRGKGIVFLWAAGNENCPIHLDSSVPIPYTGGWDGRWELDEHLQWQFQRYEWIGVQYASRFINELVNIPGVMHVAALGSTAQRSHYSNYGPGIMICAPSHNDHMYARGKAVGLPIMTISGDNHTTLEYQFGGTSSATPLVAGIAALVISANPNLKALEVISILKQTASKDLNFTGYPRTAPEDYDPNPTWDVSPVAPFNQGDFQDIDSPDGTWSPWFGHGRVDAAAAVKMALGLLPE